MYTEEIGARILGKLHDKGWNTYKKSGSGIMEGSCAEVIRTGLAARLDVGGNYVLLPVADRPIDLAAVMGTLEKLAVKLDREMPTIVAGGVREAFTGFTLNQDSVGLHVPSGLRVGYSCFLAALDTIVDAKELIGDGKEI